jgi:hypothetical protein
MVRRERPSQRRHESREAAKPVRQHRERSGEFFVGIPADHIQRAHRISTGRTGETERVEQPDRGKGHRLPPAQRHPKSSKHDPPPRGAEQFARRRRNRRPGDPVPIGLREHPRRVGPQRFVAEKPHEDVGGHAELQDGQKNFFHPQAPLLPHPPCPRTAETRKT